MADQQERTNHENTKRESAYDLLMDTQRLLLGVEPPAEDDFRLEDILAEYGGRSRPASDGPEGKDPAPPADSPAAEASPAAEKKPSFSRAPRPGARGGKRECGGKARRRSAA